MDRAISILSGGMDSAVSTAIARENHDVLMAITFNYRQRSIAKEIEAAEHLCKKWDIEHRTIDFKLLSEIGKSSLTSNSIELPNISVEELDGDQLAKLASAEQVWVPNRNGVFLNIAAAIAEAEGFQWLITGFNEEEAETFPDNSAHYVELINSCLAQSTLAKPQVVSYVKEMDKTAILKEALERKIDIKKLWCCYDGKEKWCGQCESCARTIRAMQHLEIFNKYKKCFIA